MATKFQENQRSNDQLDRQNGDIDGDDQFRYLIVRPENGGLRDLAEYTLLSDTGSGLRFLEGSDEQVSDVVAVAQRWVIVVSIIVRKILALVGKPLEWTGYVVDFVLNLLSLNGNLSGLLSKVVHGTVVVPERGTETFISTIGQLDGRINLYEGERLAKEVVALVHCEERRVKAELGNRALMDLCIMASKLAYGNAKVVRRIITDHWKMHLVDFYDCWNDFQEQMSTQVFILCDKPKDANFILVSFRGTEPFDADDWSTDFDYSWYEIPQLGKVHMGFLEALGLGNRTEVASFYNQILVHNKLLEKRKLTPQNGVSKTSSEGIRASNGVEVVPPHMIEKSAYYAVREKLENLLEEHKNSKFVVTGHSLGGALAILFPCVLVLHEELKLMERLLGVYTFGQPRVGNRQLGRYMEAHLNNPVPKYFRVVYSSDLVPRLPYDNRIFLFKHFGVCLYYDSLYNEHVTADEPNRNFGLIGLIPMQLTAAWELLRSLTMGFTYGPGYQEGWFSILLRIIGLVLPGISAHSPTNYVNSVRLGKERIVQSSY